MVGTIFIETLGHSHLSSKDNLIDGVVYPEIRDRMILLKGEVYYSDVNCVLLICLPARFDLAECLTTLLWSTIVHGDDVLAHTNWELGEDWLRTYGYAFSPFNFPEAVLQGSSILHSNLLVRLDSLWKRASSHLLTGGGASGVILS